MEELNDTDFTHVLLEESSWSGETTQYIFNRKECRLFDEKSFVSVLKLKQTHFQQCLIKKIDK